MLFINILEVLKRLNDRSCAGYNLVKMNMAYVL